MRTRQFFDIIDYVDECIGSPRPADIIGQLVPLLRDPVVETYFYKTLNDANWLIPLKEHHAFEKPPLIKPDAPFVATTFAPWSATQYLTRMAAIDPGTVVDIIRGLSDTENTSILEEFAECCLQMPTLSALQLLPETLRWTHTKHNIFQLAEKLSTLTLKYAKAGQNEAALSLLRAIIAIRPIDKRANTDKYEAYRIRSSTEEPCPYCESWS